MQKSGLWSAFLNRDVLGRPCGWWNLPLRFEKPPDLVKPGLAYFGVPYTVKERGGILSSLPRIDEILTKQLEAEMKGLGKKSR